MNTQSVTSARKVLRGELALLAAMALDSLAVVLMLYSLWGTTSITSLINALSLVAPTLSIGGWTFLFHCALVAVLMLMRRKFVPGYLLSFGASILFSALTDLHKAWVALLPQTPLCCAVYYIASYLIICLGISLSNLSGMPILPSDLFPREVSAILRCRYDRVKVAYDVACMLGAIILTGFCTGRVQGVGVGTVFSATTMGLLIRKIEKWLAMRFRFVSFLQKADAR